MKATEAKLLDFLKKSPQFIIPIYQRTYSWTEQECAQLWDDIMRAGADDRVSAHFIGSVVYIEKGLYQVTSQTPLLVIDGQQRLTTVSLILEALARHLGDEEPVDGFSARKLRNYYLLNPEESGERHFKLLYSCASFLTGSSFTQPVNEEGHEHPTCTFVSGVFKSGAPDRDLVRWGLVPTLGLQRAARISTTPCLENRW